MGQAVVHLEIVGRDGERLKSFDGELFGWNAVGDVVGKLCQGEVVERLVDLANDVGPVLLSRCWGEPQRWEIDTVATLEARRGCALELVAG